MQINKLHTCTGHQAAVYALAPGCEGHQVLSAGGDGWIVEWNVAEPETGQLVASVEARIFSLCSLDGGRRIVAGNMNGGVHWIDRENPAAIRHVLQHKKGVFSVIEAGEWVFTAGGDGVLARWSAVTARAVESYRLSALALRSVAFSPTKNKLAVGASDGAVYLLDATTLALERVLVQAHANSVFSVVFSPDNRYLLSGGRDAMLRVWDLEQDCRLVSEQAAHLFTINHIAFSPDGLLFATASRDKTLKIWETSSFRLLKVIDTLRYGAHINSVNRLLWLPACLVSGSDDRSLMLWSVENA